MAYKVLNRAKQQATTQGTGAFTLGAVAAGMQAFVGGNGVAVGGTTHYMAVNGNEWELGLGTLSAASTMQRTTVLESSNANALVNFSASPTVFGTIPGSQIAGISLPTLLFVKRAVGQTYGNNVQAKLAWDTLSEDGSGGAAWASGTPTRITVPPGKTRTRITMGVLWQSSDVGKRWILFYKNGVQSMDYVSLVAAAFETGHQLVTNWMLCVPGDYFELSLIQTSGGNLNATSWAQAEFA